MNNAFINGFTFHFEGDESLVNLPANDTLIKIRLIAERITEHVNRITFIFM